VHAAAAWAGGAAHGVQLLPHELIDVFETHAVPHLWKPALHWQAWLEVLQTFSLAAVHWVFAAQPVAQAPLAPQKLPAGQLFALQTHACVETLQVLVWPEHWPLCSQPAAQVRAAVQ